MNRIALALLLLAACGSNNNTDDDGTDGAHAYAVQSEVFGPDGTTSYVSVLGSLDAQTIDYTKARQIADLADMWAYDDAVFVAASADKTISRFTVKNGQLTGELKMSLANYGPSDVGFYRNVFVSPTKAYFLSNAEQYIIWNPTTMTITGTVDLPALPAHTGLTVFPGYSDRAATIRDGKLYQPLYWTDDTFFLMSPDSVIVELDTATDTFLTTITTTCPGLDSVTADAAGNLYFSSWVYAAGGALVLHQPDTCVVKLPAGSDTPSVAFTFKDLTGGRQGAALHSLGNGKAIMSVLHGEHATIDDKTDAGAVTFADNWRFWLYDFAANTATEINALDWNDGGQYSFAIDDTNYLLVSKSDYSATTVFDLGDTTAPEPLFDTKGWSTRLFKVR